MNDMTSTELVTINPTDVLTIFTTPKAIDPILARVRAEIDAFKPDISTATGRKAVASMAFKVAKAKTRIEEAGKALADQQKEIPKKIDATRKTVRETLEAWQAEVRKPLTEWEAKEDARVERHKAMLKHITDCGYGLIDGKRQTFAVLFNELEKNCVIGPAYEEFETEAHRVKAAAVLKLQESFAAHQQQEAERAELERLRSEAAARAKQDHEERIARDAADKAKREAEDKAAAAAKAAEDAARKEREAAERRELELKLQAEQAERRAAEAEAKAKRDAEAETARIAAESAKREADKAHKAAVNNAAKSAFFEAGFDDYSAQKIVELIALKKVPHVTISY